MEVDFLTTLINVAIMIALAVPGFILRKAKMLPDNAVAALVVVLVYVAQFFLTVNSFMGNTYSPKLLADMGVVLLLSIAFHLLIFVLAKVVFAHFPKNKAEDGSELTEPQATATNRICVVTSFLGNVGFMGIPVMNALFPGNPEMIIYTAVFIVAFNVAGWTLGVFTITGNKKDMSVRRALLNPPTIALVVALPLFFFKEYIPLGVWSPVRSGVKYLADMTLPLSMIILGVRLADMPFKSLFTDGRVYVVSFVKLIVAPLLCFVIMLGLKAAFGLSDPIIITAYIIMAMPCASTALNFAEIFNGDRQTAVKSTVLSTLLSVITIPLLMLLTVVL